MSKAMTAILIALLMSLLAAGAAASDPPSEDSGSTSSPRVTPAEEEAAARAFADAPGDFPFVWWGLEPIPWPRVVADVRTTARRLAEKHREAMIPVLKKRLERDTFGLPLVPFMIFEELRRPDEAVEFAVSSFFGDSRTGNVLLAVSHCSQPIREAVANGLLERWLDEPGVLHPIEARHLIEFAATVGNAETAELLKKHIQKITKKEAGKETPPRPRRGSKAARRRPHRSLLDSCRQAADRIERRITLSEDAKRQRSKDELLFWQTQEHAPNLASGARDNAHISAWAVVASKLRVSPDYLIEILERVNNGEPLTHEDWETALELVAAQKENAVVPSLVRIVKRDPGFRERIEETLKEMGTPAAEKGLQEIDVYCW